MYSVCKLITSEMDRKRKNNIKKEYNIIINEKSIEYIIIGNNQSFIVIYIDVQIHVYKTEGEIFRYWM